MKHLETVIFLFYIQMLHFCSMEESSMDLSKEKFQQQQLQLCAVKNPVKFGPQLFLTVSSLVNKTSKRLLELNWYNADPKEGDWIGLFNKEPDWNVRKPKGLIYRINVTEPHGFAISTTAFPYIQFKRYSSRSPQCLGFWITYSNRYGNVLTKECLHTNPNWMTQYKKEIGHFKLWELLIPGAHDAGSYTNDSTATYQNIVVRYIFDHHNNFFNMLNYGIRYFDIRVGYVLVNNFKFWMNHGPQPINPLRDALEDIREFLQINREILILDFYQFQGFLLESQHEELLEYIKQYLGNYLLPRDGPEGINITLNDIWKQKKQIVLFYNDKFAEKKVELWSGIQRLWGNKQTPEGLKSYLDDIMDEPKRPYMWVAMTELTEDVLFLIEHPDLGTGQMAEDVNHNLTWWVRDLWWNKANVIAMDYSLGSNVINEAIEANLRKHCKYQLGYEEEENY